MGDMNSSDCSWKKTVTPEANSEWISTVKLEYSETDYKLSATVMNSEHGQVPNVKKEYEETKCDEKYDEDSISATEDIDSDSVVKPAKPGRRRGSRAESESPDMRQMRLAKMSAYAAQRLANETPDQRAHRLRRMSAYAAKRLSLETSEQRAKRLSRMSAYAAKRLANESPEQRQARLARMSAYAARRQAMKKLADRSNTLIDPTETLNYNIHTMPNQS